MNDRDSTRYIPPFEMMRRSVEISTVRGQLRVSLSYDDFVTIVKRLLSGVAVDEAWYTARYEDVAKALAEGKVRSAKEHFVGDGYVEGRMPFPIAVDEAWYLEQYPDVADSIRKGQLGSAQMHFDDNGYKEGRLPFDL